MPKKRPPTPDKADKAIRAAIQLGARYGTGRGPLRKHRDDLERWFMQEVPYETIRDRLAERHKVKVSVEALRRARCRYHREAIQTGVLQRICIGAEANKRVTKELKKHGAPEVDTLVKLLQGVAFTMATSRVEVLDVETLVDLMRPVLEWSKIQIKERDTAVAERRVKLQEEQAAKAREASDIAQNQTLTPDEKMARLRELFGMSSAT